MINFLLRMIGAGFIGAGVSLVLNGHAIGVLVLITGVVGYVALRVLEDD
jgi:hypothetical protein